MSNISALLESSNCFDNGQGIAELMAQRDYSRKRVERINEMSNSNERIAFGVPLGWVAKAYLDLAGVEKYEGNEPIIVGLISANK